MAEPDTQSGQPPAAPSRARNWLFNILLILAIFTAVHWWKARPMASGEPPPLVGQTLDGEALDLAQFKGEPVLIHFWATWCPVCKAMDGSIDSISQDHQVVTVAMQSGTPAEIRDFLAQAQLDFTVVSDPYGKITNEWGVPGVPATFVLDATGRIAYSTVGISTETGLRARLWSAARSQ